MCCVKILDCRSEAVEVCDLTCLHDWNTNTIRIRIRIRVVQIWQGKGLLRLWLEDEGEHWGDYIVC
ncbi:hypothetical protein Hanom_Chr09g00865331 [Helianthus anomalus]